MEDVVKSGFCESPLGNDSVYWYVNEVKKLENKKASFLKNTKEDIIITAENEEIFKMITFVDFVKKKFYLVK